MLAAAPQSDYYLVSCSIRMAWDRGDSDRMTLLPQQRAKKAHLLLCVLAGAILAASCGDDVTPPPPPQKFDFTLTDVNVNSETYNQPVSIESYRGRPFVFYVGKAG